MTSADFVVLLPGIIISIASLVVLFQVSFQRNHFLAFLWTAIGLVLALVSLLTSAPFLPRMVTPLLIIDRYALFFMALIFMASFIVAVLAYSYFKLRQENREEFYIVLLIAVLGSVVLVASNHFASLFLGLETLTVSLYVMIAYLRMIDQPLEAGVKYLILAAASSAFLLFGMALIYAEAGTMEFGKIAGAIEGNPNIRRVFILTGTALLLVGAGFKLAVVPFHMWTPDVYEGAPAPVTAFVATVSKGAMLALLLRYFTAVGGHSYGSVMLALSLIAIASMFIGNFLALRQTNVKRILAYSSIAHLGYLLVALIASGESAVEAVSYYMVAYFITTLGAFGVVTLVSDGEGERMALNDYRGLFWTRPWLAVTFTAMLLSLAGIPLTAGFVGKFYLLIAAVGSSLWSLVIILVINSAIGLYYYLRVVVAMFTYQAEEKKPLVTPISLEGRLVLAVLTVALFYFGLYPAPLVKIIKNMASSFVAGS